MTIPSPRAERIQRVPLRIILVALLVLLMAVGLAATGFAATSLLRNYLHNQRDEEGPQQPGPQRLPVRAAQETAGHQLPAGFRTYPAPRRVCSSRGSVVSTLRRR